MKNIHLACDVGNGFTKSAINDVELALQPTAISKIIDSENNSRHIQSENQDINNIIDNIDKELDINIVSNIINGEYLVGNSALLARNTRTFNVNASANKANSDISIIMTLGMITINYVKNYINKETKLPHNCQINVQLTTALPIVEWQNAEHVKKLHSRYADNNFVVTIRNFNKPVTLNINFDKVLVASEGVVGTLALIYQNNHHYHKADFYSDFIKNNNLKDTFNGKTLKEKYPIIVGIDVGDGTTDISVTNNLKIIDDDIQFIDKGIGTAINNSITSLRKIGVEIKNRQAFLEILPQSTKLQESLNENLEPLFDDLDEKITTIFSNRSNMVQLIYFHGAGATIIKNLYNDRLQKLIDNLDSLHLIDHKIMWLNQHNSQWLNLYGLELLNH